MTQTKWKPIVADCSEAIKAVLRGVYSYKYITKRKDLGKKTKIKVKLERREIKIIIAEINKTETRKKHKITKQLDFLK